MGIARLRLRRPRDRTFKSGATTTNYFYDQTTNRLERTTGPEQHRSLSFTWSVAGRLASSSDGTTYRYDGRGRRVEKAEPNEVTIYHHDGAGRVLAESAPDGTRLRDYVYLAGKLVAAQGCLSGNAPPCSDRQWYHTDTLGSAMARTDQAGAPVARLAYQPWGERWSVTGEAGDRQYNGRVYDAGTGFHDYGARLCWPERSGGSSAQTPTSARLPTLGA